MTRVLTHARCPHCDASTAVEFRVGHRGLHLTHGDSVVYFEDVHTQDSDTGLTDEMTAFLERLHGG